MLRQMGLYTPAALLHVISRDSGGLNVRLPVRRAVKKIIVDILKMWPPISPIFSTPNGKAIRSSVKFRPKGSLISKIINQFSIKIDLKNLFRIGDD